MTDVPAAIRAIAYRAHISHAELARRINRDPSWLSRRLAGSDPVPLSVADLTVIATALHVTPAEILETGESS